MGTSSIGLSKIGNSNWDRRVIQSNEDIGITLSFDEIY